MFRCFNLVQRLFTLHCSLFSPTRVGFFNRNNMAIIADKCKYLNEIRNLIRLLGHNWREQGNGKQTSWFSENLWYNGLKLQEIRNRGEPWPRIFLIYTPNKNRCANLELWWITGKYGITELISNWTYIFLHSRIKRFKVKEKSCSVIKISSANNGYNSRFLRCICII